MVFKYPIPNTCTRSLPNESDLIKVKKFSIFNKIVQLEPVCDSTWFQILHMNCFSSSIDASVERSIYHLTSKQYAYGDLSECLENLVTSLLTARRSNFLMWYRSPKAWYCKHRVCTGNNIYIFYIKTINIILVDTGKHTHYQQCYPNSLNRKIMLFFFQSMDRGPIRQNPTLYLPTPQTVQWSGPLGQLRTIEITLDLSIDKHVTICISNIQCRGSHMSFH